MVADRESAKELDFKAVGGRSKSILTLPTSSKARAIKAIGAHKDSGGGGGHGGGHAEITLPMAVDPKGYLMTRVMRSNPSWGWNGGADFLRRAYAASPHKLLNQSLMDDTSCTLLRT